MSGDLFNVPVEKRITLSDDPIHVGRTASILVSGKTLTDILILLTSLNIFFAVTPYPGNFCSITCKMDQADKLVEAVSQVEKKT